MFPCRMPYPAHNKDIGTLYLFRDNPIDFRYEDDIDSNDEDNEANEYPDEEAGLPTIIFRIHVHYFIRPLIEKILNKMFLT